MNKLYIGDNLTILRTFDKDTLDCIVTDPPYLTKNTRLTYTDSKTEDQWIDFIKERLIECKRVMKPTATLLIHIDEKMMVELQIVLHEVFGKKNKICTFVWKKRNTASSQSKFCNIKHEYIIAYAKDIKKCKWNGVPSTNVEGGSYYNKQDEDGSFITVQHRITGGKQQVTLDRKDNNQQYPLYYKEEGLQHHSGFLKESVDKDNRQYPLYIDDGINKAQRLDKVSKTERNPDTRPNATFPIYTDKVKISLTPFPGCIEIRPMNGTQAGCWRCIPATCQKLIDANMLIIKNSKIYQKQYAHLKFDKKSGTLIPHERTLPIHTLLQGDQYPSNSKSNSEIKGIFGKTAFTYAKPLDLIKNLLKVISNENDTVLDIFAGSGTTGQAAFELKRNFILCQLDENDIPSLTKIRLDKTVGSDNYEIIEVK